MNVSDLCEPKLTYWNPRPRVQPPSYPPGAPIQFCPPGRIPAQSLPYYPSTPSLGYPITDAVHSFIQNQQISLTEGPHRRVSQYPFPPANAESLLSALSATPQNSHQMTDSLIHDEVTRAAKTLFSKRNRTLLHWLNPDVSKNQLKIDVNAAWDSLPPAEKVFYISQVLGKFAPHTTSLMVNPQIESKEITHEEVKKENMDEGNQANASTDSGYSLNLKRLRQKSTESTENKSQNRLKASKKPQKRKMEYVSDDDASCDSGLVVDLELTDSEVAKVKRKYTKRQQKEAVTPTEIELCTPSALPPVSVSVSSIKQEKKVDSSSLPRVKRKYVKRKLVRKKYKKREHKHKTEEKPAVETEKATESQSGVEEKYERSSHSPEDNCEDIDIWIDVNEDPVLLEGFELLSEEVDSFWDAIGDPNNLFMELDINME